MDLATSFPITDAIRNFEDRFISQFHGALWSDDPNTPEIEIDKRALDFFMQLSPAERFTEIVRLLAIHSEEDLGLLTLEQRAEVKRRTLNTVMALLAALPSEERLKTISSSIFDNKLSHEASFWEGFPLGKFVAQFDPADVPQKPGDRLSLMNWAVLTAAAQLAYENPIEIDPTKPERNGAFQAFIDNGFKIEFFSSDSEYVFPLTRPDTQALYLSRADVGIVTISGSELSVDTRLRKTIRDSYWTSAQLRMVEANTLVPGMKGKVHRGHADAALEMKDWTRERIQAVVAKRLVARLNAIYSARGIEPPWRTFPPGIQEAMQAFDQLLALDLDKSDSFKLRRKEKKALIKAFEIPPQYFTGQSIGDAGATLCAAMVAQWLRNTHPAEWFDPVPDWASLLGVSRKEVEAAQVRMRDFFAKQGRDQIFAKTEIHVLGLGPLNIGDPEFLKYYNNELGLGSRTYKPRFAADYAEYLPPHDYRRSQMVGTLVHITHQFELLMEFSHREAHERNYEARKLGRGVNGDRVYSDHAILTYLKVVGFLALLEEHGFLSVEWDPRQATFSFVEAELSMHSIDPIVDAINIRNAVETLMFTQTTRDREFYDHLSHEAKLRLYIAGLEADAPEEERKIALELGRSYPELVEVWELEKLVSPLVIDDLRSPEGNEEQSWGVWWKQAKYIGGIFTSVQSFLNKVGFPELGTAPAWSVEAEELAYRWLDREVLRGEGIEEYKHLDIEQRAMMLPHLRRRLLIHQSPQELVELLEEVPDSPFVIAHLSYRTETPESKYFQSYAQEMLDRLSALSSKHRQLAYAEMAYLGSLENLLAYEIEQGEGELGKSAQEVSREYERIRLFGSIEDSLNYRVEQARRERAERIDEIQTFIDRKKGFVIVDSMRV